MATGTMSTRGEYEFSGEQNQLIGTLARKMAMVGLALVLFGALQMVNGIMSLITTRNPERVIAAAKEAGLPAEKVQQLEQALASAGWLSPLTVSSIAFALGGLLMLVMGFWTQQSAAGFAGVAHTSGQDIRRLMDALGALHKKYNLIYTILWIAAIAALISIGFSLFHYFTAGS
jgi:hypothetical protein